MTTPTFEIKRVPNSKGNLLLRQHIKLTNLKNLLLSRHPSLNKNITIHLYYSPVISSNTRNLAPHHRPMIALITRIMPRTINREKPIFHFRQKLNTRKALNPNQSKFRNNPLMNINLRILNSRVLALTRVSSPQRKIQIYYHQQVRRL